VGIKILSLLLHLFLAVIFQGGEHISAHTAVVAARSELLRNRIRQAKQQVLLFSGDLLFFFVSSC